MPTPLHVYAEQKAAKRLAERLAREAALAPQEAPAPEPAPVIVLAPEAATVAGIEHRLGEAQGALQRAQEALRVASFDAVVDATPEAEQRLADAQRAVEQAQLQVERLTGALAVARQRVGQAEAATAAAARAEAAENVRRILSDRDVAAGALADALAGAVAAYRDVLRLNAEALAAYPGRPPAGGLLEHGAFSVAVQAELYRTSVEPFLGGSLGQTRLPPFPGAACPDHRLAGTPERVPGLVETVAGASNHILSTLNSKI